MANPSCPLRWPAGVPRSKKRIESRFDTPIGRALDAIEREVRLSKGTNLVVSSNVEGYLRNGAWRPYADGREPSDPGMAIYFVRQGMELAMACDQWTRLRDNAQAIASTLGAIRALQRWGVSNLVDSAFAGLRVALPPARYGWRDVLGVDGPTTFERVKQRYRNLARAAHPDAGGSGEAMRLLNDALAEAERELGGAA